MASSLEPPDIKQQISQVSLSSVESYDLLLETDIDSIMNRRWTYDEVVHLLESQFAILPGGRDKNGGSIIILQGREGVDFSVISLGKSLSYLSKIPEDSVQGQGFTLVLDMRQGTWSQMKKVLEALRLTFVEHIYQVIIMRPKSLWQRGRSSMSYNFQKSKYKFKCVMLEHSADIFQHLSPAHVPKSQNGQLDYDHKKWMDVQKTTEQYLLQLLSKRENYLALQEMLQHNPDIISLNEARDAVKHHVNIKEDLDRSTLDNLCETISHSITRLRPIISNPDFDNVYIRLEELCNQLQVMLTQLDTLWETKGDRLDRILQFKVFENDATQHLSWLSNETNVLCKTMRDIGTSVSEAHSNKQEIEIFQTSVNSKHQEINRIVKMGERLVSIGHPDYEMIKLTNENMSDKWEGLTEMVEERMALMSLAVNFYSKHDKFLLHSEGWMDQCASQLKPPDVKLSEDAVEKHKGLRDSYSEMYAAAKQDGHTLIEKLRRPIGDVGVPHEFTRSSRYIKECLENLYDEKNLVDDQWYIRHNHLKKTLNFRIFQRDTAKIFKWISDVGNQFLLSNTSIGVDVHSATSLLKSHDAFESDSEVVYSQSNLLQTRADDLSSTQECRTEEIEEEASKLEENINNFATRLDDRREVLILSIECFKAFNNFMGELESLSMNVSSDKFEGNKSELEERYGRFRTHHEIIRKIATTTFKLWNSLSNRLTASSELGKESGCTVDYSPALRTMEMKIKEMERERDRVEEVCQERENHWSMSIERHDLIEKMEEHLIQLDSWIQVSVSQVELSDNLSEAELQRDIFKRQYDQQTEESNSLIERGWEVNAKIGELDKKMFGKNVVTGRNVRDKLEVTVVKVEKGKDSMLKKAEPQLTLLLQCVEYYTLEQTSRKLNDTFNQISSTLSKLVGIGRDLNEAQRLQESAQSVEELFTVTCSEVEEFTKSVKVCEEAKQYQSTTLSILSRSLNEKTIHIKRSLTDTQRVTRAAIEFHNNYDKLKSTLEQCQTQFSSRDTGNTHVDIERQQATMKEMKQFLEEAAQVVKSHASQLSTILGGCQTQGKRESNDDISGDSTPRLLVTPRKVRQDKSPPPSSSLSASQAGQQVIEELIREMYSKVNKVIRFWTTRNTRLEQSKQVIKFEGEVPKILKWLDDVGIVFLDGCKDYGKSLEEVEELIQNHQNFEKDSMESITTQVEELRNMIKTFEETGHYELNRIRSIGSHLEQRWNQFECDMKTRYSNLKLSLSFQDNLFEGSNWCMQSEQFLQSLDDKVNHCDTSDEVSSLSAELSVYLSVTKREQMERVSQIQHISSFLHSNPLVELAQQLNQSTDHMLKDFETAKNDLQSLYSRLLHIEEEKDKEMRMMKQKQRVMEELLSTEEAFVNDLKLVVETYKPRFISDFLPDSLRGKETIVFGNIQWIAEFHIETLLPGIISANGDADEIAQVFIDNAEIMTDLYVPYCKNKTPSEELLASHRSYLTRVQSLFGTVTPLSSLLIKPIQRITKYPLLLKDALKYTKSLNQSTTKLELALAAVEEIPVQTNNAINLSLLQSDEGLNWHKYGELIYQGSLMVSEPRLLITSEKERQVFIFENTIVFARKIELGQAKFKYEYKFRIALTAGVQVVEFLENEPCKFALFTSDHRIHLRASSVDIKQAWIKSLRTAIHKHVEEEAVRLRSMTESRIRSNTMVTNDIVARDLRDKISPGRSPTPRRPSSPFTKARINVQDSRRSTSPHVSLGVYKVTVDYEPFSDDHHGISLKVDQTVEVLERLEDGRWFVQATTITGQVEHGWVPSTILEPLPPEEISGDEDIEPRDETDFDTKNRRYTTAFGNQDLMTHQVISNLKKATLGDHGSTPPLSTKTTPKHKKILIVTPLNRDSLSQNGQKSPIHSPRTTPSPQPIISYTSSSPVESTSEFFVQGPKEGVNKRNEETKLSMQGSKLKRKVVVRRSKSRQRSQSEPPSSGAIHHSSSEDSMNGPLSPLGIEKEEEEKEEETLEEKEEEEEKVDELMDKEKREKAELKLQYIMAELLETEKEYVNKLEKLVNGFIKEIQECPNLPESLVGKERMIFGNVASIYEFHRDVFQSMLEQAKDSQESIAKCFLEKGTVFKLYVTYCENKPKSESFLWTYAHQGGTFFKEVKEKYELREDIDSFLIKPVQRITKYQLLLKDLMKTSHKIGLPVPALEEAVQLMQDVPKQANDAMALSMIVGYQGNIHANGQIVLQDEFTVYEKSRWAGGARRHVFLLDLVILITKEKDSDGLYVFKDSLKVHKMTITEKQDDSPCRFVVGTGQIGDWEQYYILEAASPEKKQEWVKNIKEILNQQFQMLKALKLPNYLKKDSFDSTSVDGSPTVPRLSVTKEEDDVGFISDSSLEDSEEDVPLPSPVVVRKRLGALTQEEDTRKHSAYAVQRSASGSPKANPRIPNLYIAGDDCAPPTSGQRILYIKKGQIYDILDHSGNWWLGRLIRDITGSDVSRGTEGWVPRTFMDSFQGQLSYEEEMFARFGEISKKTEQLTKYSTLPSRTSGSQSQVSNNRNSMFPMFSKSEDKKKKEVIRTPKGQRKNRSNAPQITTHLSDETVLSGHGIQFKCVLAEDYPDMTVEWLHDSLPLKIERAFISSGQTCLLNIKNVYQSDEGTYTCVMTTPTGETSSSSAKLTVLGSPNPPSKPEVKQITSTSVSLSWTPPSFDGHSPITLYLVECKDTHGGRWSTLMKRIIEPSTIVSDLVPGTEYIFRVIAGNTIGSSDPSDESDPIHLITQTSIQSVFSLEPFDTCYSLSEKIADGQYGVVYECLHEATQQSYAAKLTPLAVGHNHANRELSILCKLNHPNLVQMTSAYLTEKHYIIVMQYINGLTVYKYFVTNNPLASSELIARCGFQLVSGLAYLHELNIVHLAIKPDNIIVYDRNTTGTIELKIIHLSDARELTEEELTTPSSQSYVEYQAPEILLKQSVSTATDMWGVGVMLYTLLGGTPPFLVDSLDLTKENIKKVRLSFPTRMFKGVSEESKHLVSQLLQKDQSTRLSAALCLKDVWLQTGVGRDKEGHPVDMTRLISHLERTK